jgi:hypothetical protein
MPTQDGIGANDCRDFHQRFATQYFPLDGQTPALIIAKQNPFLTEFFSEHFIFGLQIINNILLFAVDPPGQDEEEQLPRLQNEVHISPDAGLAKKNSIGHR